MFLPVHGLNGKHLSLVAKICSVWSLFLTQWSDWKEFHYRAGHFFFLWGIEKVNAILSSLKLPQNFIILTSKSTSKFIQRTRGLELAATACLILVEFQKTGESSEQGQGQLHIFIRAPLFLPSFPSLSILRYERQDRSISITLDTIDSRAVRTWSFLIGTDRASGRKMSLNRC